VAKRLNRRVGQGQSRRRMVEARVVDYVVSMRQLVMRKEKGWITLYCFIQQANGFE
jgi:hypothetical protein